MHLSAPKKSSPLHKQINYQGTASTKIVHLHFAWTQIGLVHPGLLYELDSQSDQSASVTRAGGSWTSLPPTLKSTKSLQDLFFHCRWSFAHALFGLGSQAATDRIPWLQHIKVLLLRALPPLLSQERREEEREGKGRDGCPVREPHWTDLTGWPEVRLTGGSE